jgi:hypothetical protein
MDIQSGALSIKVSKDKRDVKVTAEFGASALGLEEVIFLLGQARAEMDPPVPFDRPESGDAKAIAEDNPSAIFGLHADGSLAIWLRNSGYGWLTFNVPAHDVLGLRQLLSQKVDNPTTAH